MKKTWIAAALACLCISPAWADPPPAAAPPYRAGVSLQPVTIYDALGNVVGASGGSVTAPGTSGSQAQAVQGITGGVPVAIQGGNAAAVKTDGSSVTQPVSATSLPLPSGAATSAKQPALGAAGTPSADVLTVQGAAAMTALKVDGSAMTQPVSAAALPLPSGAATSAAQSAGNTSLASIDSKAPALVSGRVPVDGSAVTQPVSAASLPLPSGAATAANQTTELASLATIAQRAALFTDAAGLATTANGTFNGTIRDLGAAPSYTRVNVAVYSSQNGTVTIQACTDAACATGFLVASQPVNTSTSVFATLNAPVYTRYMRVIFNNGATAGAISISSSFTAN